MLLRSPTRLLLLLVLIGGTACTTGTTVEPEPEANSNSSTDDQGTSTDDESSVNNDETTAGDGDDTSIGDEDDSTDNSPGDSDQEDDGEDATEGEESEDPGDAIDPANSETLYIGTGEYLASQDWHAILRFDGAGGINGLETGVGADADATVNVQASGDTDGVFLNFVHTLFLDESNDELYAGAIFTTAGDQEECNGVDDIEPGCGSVAIFSNASNMDGAQTLSRHIYGDQTEIVQPHGVWVDVSRDILYVTSTFAYKIVVYDSASAADGNMAPSRTIEYDNMGAPVHVYTDNETDRLFIAAMGVGSTDGQPKILIYNNASTLDGESAPDIIIQGESTRLDAGNNQTTHNVWFIPSTEELIVGHHTNEVLFYDLTGINWEPDQKPLVLDTAPRVLEINEEQDGSDAGDWSCYGFFYVEQTDCLYVAAGYTPQIKDPNPPSENPPPDNSRVILHGYQFYDDAFLPAQQSSGPPKPGSGPGKSQINVYCNVTDPDKQGVVDPDREIYWNSGEQYYPPQPLWVTFE